MAMMNYNWGITFGGPSNPKATEAKCKVLVEKIESLLEDEIRWYIDKNPMHMTTMLTMKTRKSGLGRAIEIDRFEGMDLDTLALKLTRDFRDMIDEQKKKKGYPKKTTDPWERIGTYPSMPRNAATAIVDKHLAQMQKMMIDNAAMSVMNGTVASTLPASPPKSKPNDYRAKLQKELNDWLH